MATGAFPLCGIERNHDHIQRQYRESRQAATKIRSIERESRVRSGDQVPNESRFSDIIGSGPALQFVLAEVERVAATDLTWRRCEPRAGEDCPRTTRSKSKQDCWERMASTGGSCFVITPWWKKYASIDGTRRERTLSRGNRKKSGSEKRMWPGRANSNCPGTP